MGWPRLRLRRRLAAASAARADSPPLQQHPVSITVTSIREGWGEQCHGPERDGKRGKEKEGWREKAGTSCSSRLVQAASRRQPKGMGNVCAALSGLHELYMTCYVKMLPVYCVSCSFLPPLFFSSLTPFLPPSSSLLSRAQSLLCFSATKYSLDVKC